MSSRVHRHRPRIAEAAHPGRDANVRVRASSGDTGLVGKRCADCKKHKPLKAFLPTAFSEDGLVDVCKPCIYAAAERDRRDREARRSEAEARKAARTPAPTGVVTKKCKGCGVAKPLTEYSKHGSSRDGHRHTCKPCVTAARAKRRAEISIEDLAAGRAKHLANNHAAVKKWRGENTDAVNAQASLQRAVKSGILARPARCQVKGCKARGKLEAHHFSYDQPLLVLWTCRHHHTRLHAGDKIETVVGLPPVLAADPKPKQRRSAS